MKEQKLIELLGEMSLSEKIHQLLQVTTGFYDGDAMLTGPVREGGITEESIEGAGSVIGLLGAEKYKEIQDAYMKKHPHHIPLLVCLDVINGFRTVFPIPLGQGAAFDPELAQKCAAIAAKEAAVSGVHVTFAPMVDLVRDARWGRVMEAFGEDTKLSCDYAAAVVKGFQGTAVGEPYKVSACIKHFAAYGAPVAGRDYNTVELSENTLRGYYLPAYQAGIEAGAEMVMTSFQTLNGIPSTGNEKLMKGILREEMGFEGVLISDWAAIEELCCHGYAKDRREAAYLAMMAGVDIDMMTGIYSKELQGLIESGKISLQQLDESVLRILRLKNKLGLFENPYKDADPEGEKKYILSQEHRKAALEAAEKSCVLLKNEEILPLQKGETAAFIGPFATEREIYGAWSMMGRPGDTVSIQKAAEEFEDFLKMTFSVGCPIVDRTQKDLVPPHFYQDMPSQEQEQLFQEAVKEARSAQKVVLCLGEHRCMSGEAASRASVLLPQVQLQLLDAVYKVNQNIILVLFTGRPLDLHLVEPKVKAVLNVWMPGTEGGNAVMNLLSGRCIPSGKLPMSFPYCSGQAPVYYNEYFTGRPYDSSSGEKSYRSNYRDIPNDPLYPFGYGLSYTTFVYGNLMLDKESMGEGQELSASITLKNTGNYQGCETVQMYIRDCAGSVVRPKKELKDYKKIWLKPGEEQKVTFTIREEMLRFVKSDESYGSEKGEFRVFVGTDSTAEESAVFYLI